MRRGRRGRKLGRGALGLAPVAVAALMVATGLPAQASTAGAGTNPQSLSAAARALVGRSDGPPGVIVVVDRGGHTTVVTAGTSTVGAASPMTTADHLRLASVSKAFSGAVALSLVSRRVLRLKDTVGRWLPDLPAEWSKVTLAELLQHTSGIPDYTQGPRFVDALLADPLSPPPPTTLLGYVTKPDLWFPSGTQYRYSNSDNIIVALMVEAATGHSYAAELNSLVLDPWHLTGTSLPVGATMPAPLAPGYQLDPPASPEDVTEQFAAGWSWSSGGMVSTPLDATTFVRTYVRGASLSPATRAAQFTFRPGSSEPPGPGTNSAGLGVFRYQTRCGTVYGHTGNTSGYTQFIAASANGSDSVTVSINAQVTPTVNSASFPALLAVESAGVCAALGH